MDNKSYVRNKLSAYSDIHLFHFPTPILSMNTTSKKGTLKHQIGSNNDQVSAGRLHRALLETSSMSPCSVESVNNASDVLSVDFKHMHHFEDQLFSMIHTD